MDLHVFAHEQSFALLRAERCLTPITAVSGAMLHQTPACVMYNFVILAI